VVTRRPAEIGEKTPVSLAKVGGERKKGHPNHLGKKRLDHVHMASEDLRNVRGGESKEKENRDGK